MLVSTDSISTKIPNIHPGDYERTVNGSKPRKNGIFTVPRFFCISISVNDIDADI